MVSTLLLGMVSHRHYSSWSVAENCEKRSISYNTIVLNSRYHKGVGVAHEKTSPKNQPQIFLTTMRQYWLGKTKPNKLSD